MVTKSEKKFPSALKNILAQFEIKNVTLANAIGVTSQYISKLLSGKSLPSREQMDAILVHLNSRQVPIAQQRMLISCFVEDKTGFFYEIADLEFTAKNQLEKKLLSDFRMLSIESQKKALSNINELLISAL